MCNSTNLDRPAAIQDSNAQVQYGTVPTWLAIREVQDATTRIWLAPPGARPLPEVYKERFGSITPGDRGGVVVPPTIPFE